MTRKKLLAAAAASIVSAGVVSYGANAVLSAASADPAADRPPACALEDDSAGPPSGPPALGPTTVTTIGQVFHCILDNYYRGPLMDDRELLVPAFAAFTQDLARR